LIIGTHSGSGSATVDRALDLLAVLKDATEPMGVRDLARRLELSPATTHRLLSSLRSHGFVTQTDGTRTYRLGWGLLDYANALLRRTDLVELAGPLARSLRDETGETITVQVPVGLERVCVHEVEGAHEVRRRVGVGRSVPLHAGASGRAILAFMSPSLVDRVLVAMAPLTPRTETNPDRLRALLAETARSGVAVSAGETTDGVASVATPVFDGSGSVVGSIAVSGPSERCTAEVLGAYRASLLATGREVSRRLGFRGPMPWLVGEQATSSAGSAA
jgi:DNA-binding IclR family transcriptional regulator